MFQNGKVGDEVVINTGGGSKFRSHISSISEFNGKFSIFIPEQFRYGWDTPGYRQFSPVTGKADDLPQRGGMSILSLKEGNIVPSKNIEGVVVIFSSEN
jgi:hypothetical protein